MNVHGYKGRNKLVRRRIQVVVSRLRKKLRETVDGDIVSVREKGYCLILS
jgi:DNA-binding response OmpR family regulator